MTTPLQYNVPPVPPRKASGGVIALGVINIVYGALFHLCCGVGALVFSNAIIKFAETRKTQIPSLEMLSSGAVRSYMMISTVVLLVLGILILVGGIGLLKLRPWGRSLSMGVAAAEIVWVLVSYIISIFFISPLAAQTAGEGVAQGPQMVLSVIAQIVSAFLNLVYPIILLICLNLRSIREQFEFPSQQQIVP